AEIGIERAKVALEVLVGHQIEQLEEPFLLRLLPHPRGGLARVPHVVTDLVEDEALDDVATVALAGEDRQRRHVDRRAPDVRVAPLLALGGDVDREPPTSELTPA